VEGSEVFDLRLELHSQRVVVFRAHLESPIQPHCRLQGAKCWARCQRV